VSDEAELEAFRLALAAQATPIQVSAYLALVKSTRGVVSTFEDLRVLLENANVSPEMKTKKLAFDESLEKTRSATRVFLESFSDLQNLALKQTTSKLVGADSRLSDRTKALEVRIGNALTQKVELATLCSKVGEALDNLREQQRLLGKAMYAVPDPEEEQPIFTLPASTNSATVGSQTIAVRTSGTILRSPAERLSNGIHLQIVANLGDLQQSMTAILQTLFAQSDPCGERVAIQRSMVSIAPPTADIWVQFHLERRICPGDASKVPLAVFESNGAVNVKITPTIQTDGSLTMLTQTDEVQASGVLADMLRSGDLGAVVRERIKYCVLRALQNGLNLQAMLLPVRPNSGAIETAKFVRDSQSGTLDIAFDGHLRLSDEEVGVLNHEKYESRTVQGSPPR
jgi:hypothetical protein